MPTYSNPTFVPTFQGLCDAVADTLNRQDLVTGIPNFVALATFRIRRDIARVRHPKAIVRSQSSITANYASLPDDFQAPYQVMDQDGGSFMTYVSPDASKDLIQANNPVNALQTYYTIIGNTLRIYPAPGSSSPAAIDLWYYADLPDLSTTATTNWVLTRYPDLYLYGSLLHSAPYLKSDERIALWDSVYNRILADIEIEADRATRPQSKLTAVSTAF